MRLKISSFICMLLLIINIIPASASEKGIIVSIDNIDEIVIDNNIELKIAKNSLESKIQYYDDLDEEISRLEEEKKEFMELLVRKEAVTGIVVLCTCNRSEVYVSGTKYAIGELQREIADYKNIRLEELLKYLNIYSGESAIRHLFKVACGFDSMVLGEDEILGQVKDAYQMSKAQKTVDYEMNVLFQKAVTCAKRIKTDTRLSKTPLSIATLVANEVFRFENGRDMKKVMVIGMSGKMGSIITKNIISKPGIEITGTVRRHNACLTVNVQSDRVKVVDYRDRYQYMNDMDIVISATLGPHYTVTYEELSKVLEDGRKRLFIDVAVPVDMDPSIGEIDGLSLFDIDFKKQYKDQVKGTGPGKGNYGGGP